MIAPFVNYYLKTNRVAEGNTIAMHYSTTTIQQHHIINLFNILTMLLFVVVLLCNSYKSYEQFEET